MKKYIFWFCISYPHHFILVVFDYTYSLFTHITSNPESSTSFLDIDLIIFSYSYVHFDWVFLCAYNILLWSFNILLDRWTGNEFQISYMNVFSTCFLRFFFFFHYWCNIFCYSNFLWRYQVKASMTDTHIYLSEFEL